MAQHQTDSVQGHTLTQHFRGGGVTEEVGAFRGGVTPAFFSARLTTPDTQWLDTNGVNGAICRRKTWGVAPPSGLAIRY